MKKLNFISTINTICLIMVSLFWFWLMVQFPETQSGHSDKTFQQTIDQEQSIEEVKKVAKNFSRVVNYTQGATKLVGVTTILLNFSLIILLSVNFFVMRKMKKSFQQNNA